MLSTDLLLASILLPIAAASIAWRRSFSFSPLLLSFLIFSYLIDVVGNILQYLGETNIFVINFYFIAQTLIIPIIFMSLKWRSEANKVFNSLILLCSFLISTYMLMKFKIGEYPSIGYALSSFLVILLSGHYIVHETKYNFNQELWRSPWFYVIAGLYIYHSSITIIYLLLFEIGNDIYELWPLKMTAYLIHNIFMAMGYYTLNKDWA